MFAQDETPYNDSDSDSDTDDRTPLVNPANRGTSGGTFNEEYENPFQRAARSISIGGIDFVATSGRHSINAEQTDGNSTDRSTESSISSAISYGNCTSSDEIHAHTRPGTSNDEKRDVVV